MRLILEQQYMVSVLNSQYHACWCTGDFKSQWIGRHGIDLQIRDIPSPVSEELISVSSRDSWWRMWVSVTKIPHGLFPTQHIQSDKQVSYHVVQVVQHVEDIPWEQFLHRWTNSDVELPCCLFKHMLTHGGREKWLPCCRCFQVHFNNNFGDADDISLKHIPYSLIDNMQVLI